MRFLKTILATASIAAGAGLLAACGGAGEPQSTAIPSAIATATAQPEVDPTKGGTQDVTPTPVPTAKAAPAALLEPTSDVPTGSPTNCNRHSCRPSSVHETHPDAASHHSARGHTGSHRHSNTYRDTSAVVFPQRSKLEWWG